VYKLAALPFDCLLLLRANARETQRPHSFMTEIEPRTMIRIDGRDWAVGEIHDRPGELPVVVCRPAV
jgi:hypothetical protein